MDTIEKNENRDLTITLKVTNDEKELLQRMADETGLSLSDFIRRKAAAEEKFFEQLINENTKLKEENKDLKVKVSFGLPTRELQNQGNLTVYVSLEKQKIYESFLLNKMVQEDPDDEGSNMRTMKIDERIIYHLDYNLFRPTYDLVSNGSIYRVEQPVKQLIREGYVSLDLVRSVYPEGNIEF
ncbi:hypothetical protein CYCD_10410 [Tenuifilaceae bacterium CYCD]|nr:hypothetical protein CYCD_10410 [Tenuifilaceae bacterium CYCD]